MHCLALPPPLLLTGSRARGAHVDRRAGLLELKVVCCGAILDEVSYVLGVTGVANPLDAYALGGVRAGTGAGE